MITFLAIAVAVWLAGYYVSLRLHPYTACERCRGGRHYGMLFNNRWRPCHACDGRGRKQRWGAKRLDYGMPRFWRPTRRQAPRSWEWQSEGRH